MSCFASTRERRLWGWSLATAVAIFSTLGIGPSAIGALRDEEWLARLFALGLLLLAATIVTRGLSARPRGIEVAVGLGVSAVLVLLLARTTATAERTHLVEYGILAVFVLEALTERAANGRRVVLPPLTAVLATALVGTLDETLQSLLPHRVFDPLDIVFNAAAAASAVAASTTLAWARRRIR